MADSSKWCSVPSSTSYWTDSTHRCVMLLPTEKAFREPVSKICNKTTGQSGHPPPPLKEQKLKIIPQGILLPSWTLQQFTVRFPSVGLSWLGLLHVKSICSRLIKHWIDFLFSGVFLKGLYPWNPSSELVEHFPFGNVILGTISPCSHPPLLRYRPHRNHLA